MQPVQIKMARAALDLSVENLAREASVPAADVRELEEGGMPGPEALHSLSLFFAASGIELIDSDGVRAKPRETADAVSVEDLTTGNDGGQG